MHSPVLPARSQEHGLKEPGERITHSETGRENFKKAPVFSFREQQSPLPAPGFGEGVEAWLAAVTLLAHHAGFAAALAVAVALGAEGACGDRGDRHLKTSPVCQPAALPALQNQQEKKAGSTASSLPRDCL